MTNDSLKIADRNFDSRIFLGTGKYSSLDLMSQSIKESQTEMVTIALKRHNKTATKGENILDYIDRDKVQLLPNTSGARNAKEAILATQLACESMQTNWVKLEIHPDPKYLLPDAEETLNAAKELVKLGYIVLPYIHADPLLCKKLEDIGVAAVMPLGSLIGSNQGLKTKTFLEIIIEQSLVPVIIDAGIGKPSHAAQAMEMGADAVLVNTAIAISQDPILMSQAFDLAVKSGRMAYNAKNPSKLSVAKASSPLTSFLTNK